MHAARPKTATVRAKPGDRPMDIGSATEGATSMEYAMIAALVGAVIFVTLAQVGDNLRALPFPALIAALTGATDT